MISDRSRSREWIYSLKREKEDPAMIERMVMAFSLLEALKISNLNFTFKGGTSVSLITGDFSRFSTDIDIVVPPGTDITPYFETILKVGIFSDWVEDKRENDSPGQHFKFSYASVIQNKYPMYVLLDVLYANNLYTNLQATSLISNLLEQKGDPCMLLCPTKDSLLGDKLTTIAIHTTGIRIDPRKEKAIGILKQLFDISHLFDISSDIAGLFRTFENISKFELETRGMSSLSTGDVAQDIVDTAIMIGARGEIGSNTEFSTLASQIPPLRSYVFKGSVSQDSLILWASKAAYLGAMFLSGNKELVRYEGQEVCNLQMNRYSKLNKLIKTSPESFFYFVLALSLLEQT